MTIDPFDPAEFKAFAAQLGITTKVVTDSFGRTDVLIDRAGLRALADHAPVGRTRAHAIVDQLLAAAADQLRGDGAQD
ncbi:hypothetical protein [Kitasatospora sp. NPDC007106]|uniref:hypothetical protein n=1 Tax=Kitasatospora sp. NPDC007106 TaxID=3156914 RepID=UPI0033CBC8D6